MKTTCVLAVIQLLRVHADVVFEQRSERESLTLTWRRQREADPPSGLLLYHRGAHAQTTLLSLTPLRLDPEHGGRLQVSGGLSSPRVNATLSDLRPSDSGLYLWEVKYSRNQSDLLVVSSPKVLLLVDVAGEASKYRPLLFTICTAAGLLLLTLVWLFAESHVRKKPEPVRPTPLHPVYEEMTRKQQNPENSQNPPGASTHLQEVYFPLYANPNVRQCQENYYASPRPEVSGVQGFGPVATATISLT